MEEYFGDGARLGLRMTYSREPSPLGTAGALRHAAAMLADAFLVIYGDSYLPIQYEAAFRKLLEADAEAIVVVYDNSIEDTAVKNNVELDDNGYVSRYEKDSSEPLRYVEAGVLALRRSVIDGVPAEGAVSLEQEIFPKLIARCKLGALVTRQRFYDIGTPRRLQAIEKFLSRDHGHDHH